MAGSDAQLDIVLQDDLDDVGTGAEPKFLIRGTNLGGDYEQDAGLIDADIGGNALIVKCDITQAVHGTMFEDGSPATLAVFQFAFVPRGNNRRFKEVEITITFSAGELHDIAPQHVWAMFRSEKEQELSHAVSPGLEAGFGPGKATLGYTWQRKETKTIEDQARVEGLKRALAQGRGYGRKRMNTAFWGLYENKQTESGVPSFMQTAVLLKRERLDQDPLGKKFSAEITIRGEVDRHTYIKDKWESIGKKMSGRKRKGEDIIFNPEVSQGTVINAKNLIQEDLDAYKQLVTVHEWVDGNANAMKKKGEIVPCEQRSEEKPCLPEQVDQAPGITHREPARQSPLDLVSESIAIPTVAASGPSVRKPAEDVKSDSQTSNGHIQSLGPSYLLPGQTNPTRGNPIPSTSSAGREPATSEPEKLAVSTTAGEEVTQKLLKLEAQLSKVRTEANLVRQLIRLEEEERRVFQEIMQLEGLASNK